LLCGRRQARQRHGKSKPHLGRSTIYLLLRTQRSPLVRSWAVAQNGSLAVARRTVSGSTSRATGPKLNMCEPGRVAAKTRRAGRNKIPIVATGRTQDANPCRWRSTESGSFATTSRNHMNVQTITCGWHVDGKAEHKHVFHRHLDSRRVEGVLCVCRHLCSAVGLLGAGKSCRDQSLTFAFACGWALPSWPFPRLEVGKYTSVGVLPVISPHAFSACLSLSRSKVFPSPLPTSHLTPPSWLPLLLPACCSQGAGEHNILPALDCFRQGLTVAPSPHHSFIPP
jgi:hypothetical protein